MPTIFDAINSHITTRAALKSRSLYMQGDHWQGGAGWVGPSPEGATPGDVRDAALGLVKKAFVSKGLIKSACVRHRDAVVSREPLWTFGPDRPLKRDEQPTAQEQALMGELNAALTPWWDDGGMLATWQSAVLTLLWASEGAKLTGAPMRLHIKASATVNGGIPRGSLSKTIDAVGFSHLSPLNAGVVRDADGAPLYGYYSYPEGDKQRLEIVALAETLDSDLVRTATPYARRIREGDTVILITEDGEVRDAAAYPLGGLLTIYEMRREPLITPPAVALQKAADMAYTMMTENVIESGFLERTLLNAQIPGRWVKNGEPVAEGTEGAEFVPSPMQVGTGTMQAFGGMPIYDESGQIRGYTTPSVQYREPTPVTIYRETIQELVHAFLEEVAQLHILISGDSTASGKSRIQATNDFVASLGTTASELEAGIRWQLTAASRLASYFSGNKPTRYDGLRPVVDARLSAVQPTREDADVAVLLREQGLIDTEEAMSRVGVEDTGDMLQRVAEERAAPPPNEGDENAQG